MHRNKGADRRREGEKMLEINVEGIIRYDKEGSPPTLAEARRVLRTQPINPDRLGLLVVRSVARDCIIRGLPKKNEQREIAAKIENA